MVFDFQPPEQAMIVFAPFANGDRRNPLKIPLCSRITTRKVITVAYIARDGRTHRHKYDPKRIERIVCGSEIIYQRAGHKKRFV